MIALASSALAGLARESFPEEDPSLLNPPVDGAAIQAKP